MSTTKAAPPGTPLARVLGALDAIGHPAKRNGRGWKARCPIHDDRNASLDIGEGDNGKVMIYCHACGKDATGEIVKALGLAWNDLFVDEPGGPRKTGNRIVATYDYTDETGALLYQAVRFQPKDFRQRRPDGRGGWAWNLEGVRRVLYHLPNLLAADPTEQVLVVEGEKDADRLIEAGFVATTNAMGAKKWKPEYSQALRGRHVCLIPDNDPEGKEHAERIAADLQGKAAEVRLLELQDLPQKGDVSDWLDAGNTPDQLRRLAEQAPECWRSQLPPGKYRLSDLGNAERFVHLHGDDVRYCEQWGQWLVWDGIRWAPDARREVDRRAKATVQAIYLEALALPRDSDLRPTVAAWASKSDGAKRLRDMLALARCEVAVTPDELDADPFLLNARNGVVDLHTGKLLPHDAARMQAKLAPVVYDLDAPSPRWDAFIEEVTDGDDDLAAFLQRLAGLFLTGDISEHILPICWGSGANGKSVFLDTLLGLLADYSYKAPARLLVSSGKDEHACEVAALQGKRLVVSSETEEGRRLRVSLVKELTGDASLTGRFMRQNYFSFPRTCKVVLVTNNKPVVPEQSHAIWRRIRLIPFVVTIPPERQDKALTEKLRDEWPGILAWAVRGCLDWQENGLGEPAAVAEATDGYREEEDQIAAFLEDRCTIAEGFRAPKARIWATYATWCKDVGETPMTSREFTHRMRQHGFGEDVAKIDGKSSRVWLGILPAATM